MIAWGPLANCEIQFAYYSEYNRELREFLARLPSEADLSVIRLDEYLCGRASCKTMIDNTMLYRDAAHLSVEGSYALARSIGLFDLIRATAR